MAGGLSEVFRIVWTGDTSGATRAQRKLRNEMRITEAAYQRAAGTARRFGLAAAATAAGAIRIYQQQERAEIQLAATIKQLGREADVSVSYVKRLATELQRTSEIGDETALAAATLGLRLGNLSRQQIAPFLTLAADFSTVMGKDMVAASQQLARYLADPAQGISRMGQAGITFTLAQKEMIRTMVDAGKKAEAQNYLMGQLAHQFGGAAVETLKGAGALKFLTNAAGDFVEGVGKELFDTLRSTFLALGDWMWQTSENTRVMKLAADGVKYLAQAAAGLGIVAVALRVKLLALAAAKLAVSGAANVAAVAVRGLFGALGLIGAFVAAGYLPDLANWLAKIIDNESEAMKQAKSNAGRAFDEWERTASQIKTAQTRIAELRGALAGADDEERERLLGAIEKMKKGLDDLIAREKELAQVKENTAKITEQQAKLENARADVARWNAAIAKSIGEGESEMSVDGGRATYTGPASSFHRSLKAAEKRMDDAQAAITELASANAKIDASLNAAEGDGKGGRGGRGTGGISEVRGGGKGRGGLPALVGVGASPLELTRRQVAAAADARDADNLARFQQGNELDGEAAAQAREERAREWITARRLQWHEDDKATLVEQLSAINAIKDEDRRRREELLLEHKLREDEERTAEQDLYLSEIERYGLLEAQLRAELRNDERAAERKERKLRLQDELKYGKEAAKIRAIFRSKEWLAAKETADGLVSLETHKSSKLRAIGKAARRFQQVQQLAQAIANLHAGIAGSFTRAAEVFPPPLAQAVGAAGAAAVVASTAAQISALRSAERGGVVEGLRAAGDTQTINTTAGEVIVPERDFAALKRGIINEARNDDGDGERASPQQVEVVARLEMDERAGALFRADISRADKLNL